MAGLTPGTGTGTPSPYGPPKSPARNAQRGDGQDDDGSARDGRSRARMSSATLAPRPALAADDGPRGRILSLRDGLSHGLIGADRLVERLLIGLLTGGHLL